MCHSCGILGLLTSDLYFYGVRFGTRGQGILPQTGLIIASCSWRAWQHLDTRQHPTCVAPNRADAAPSAGSEPVPVALLLLLPLPLPLPLPPPLPAPLPPPAPLPLPAALFEPPLLPLPPPLPPPAVDDEPLAADEEAEDMVLLAALPAACCNARVACPVQHHTLYSISCQIVVRAGTATWCKLQCDLLGQQRMPSR